VDVRVPATCCRLETAGWRLLKASTVHGGICLQPRVCSLKPAVDPQPLGDREHELPVRNFSAEMLGDPTGFLQCPLLVAGGAETPSQVADWKLEAAGSFQVELPS
jgi:hypothetical protein